MCPLERDGLRQAATAVRLDDLEAGLGGGGAEARGVTEGDRLATALGVTGDDDRTIGVDEGGEPSDIGVRARGLGRGEHLDRLGGSRERPGEGERGPAVLLPRRRVLRKEGEDGFAGDRHAPLHGLDGGGERFGGERGGEGFAEGAREGGGEEPAVGLDGADEVDARRRTVGATHAEDEALGVALVEGVEVEFD
ncbi:MAG: hypothetical protein EPO65_02735 [Dehalococcoidia bacterium]|nr:MAG: hypothetical protein EPO65_02735 [Dehalococcoidia bacterium]